jgi:Flp pilus assembly protein TadD
MQKTNLRLFLAIAIAAGCAYQSHAGDLRIHFPKRTKPTPVQALNQEGVKAVKKHHLADAEKLFYRAYLIDPDDPFTLNNLGYVSELQGKVERAQRYYELASRQNSETVIAEASSPEFKGRQLAEVTANFGNRELRINHGNVQAMSLLAQGRTQEADAILQRTLALNPKNPFTLNNLGYTMEAEGELEKAIQYYERAAGMHSSEKIEVALDPRWRGKDISSVAANNAKVVRNRLESGESLEARVARLNLQGVSALNHNDVQAAERYFREAYRLDPRNAFAMNNIGYVAELEGDQETAAEFYAAAKLAEGAKQRVGLANRREMQGLSLVQVASANDEGAQANLESLREARTRQGGEIQLKTRDNKPVIEPTTSPSIQEEPSTPPPSGNSQPQNPPTPQNPQ